MKPGHVADLEAPVEYVEERLSTIRGHLVEAQLDFLSEEEGWTSDDSFIWSGAERTVVVYT